MANYSDPIRAGSANVGFNGINRFRKARKNQRLTSLLYEQVEPRKVLAAIYPAYINGVLTLGNPDPNAAAPYPLAETFNLSSRPSATKTIYIDLNGHLSQNNEWGHTINFPAFDRDGNPSAFSDSELIEIQLMFQSVSEDFSPFDVNVTTKEPTLDALIRTDSGDQVFGMRCVHTQATDGFGDGIGGVAYLDSFGSPDDTPCFAFNKGVVNGSMTISHEVGHTLGLRHDGLNGQAYHPGTGSGPTSWGPIMGAPFGKTLVQWSPGDYAGANNTENDYGVITSSQNGFGFVPDDYGNSIATAGTLPVNNQTASHYGFVSGQNDVDVFKFKAGNGTATFSIKPFTVNPNLDVIATIYNSSGNIVTQVNPIEDNVAEFSVNLSNGTYYLAIDGTGKSGVYSQYGSVGFYTINANIPVPANTIGESAVITGLNSQWKTITLRNTYENPVIVIGAPSRLGLDPVTIRVRNVRPNSFDVRVDEWEYQDGVHGREDVSYLVLEAGLHELPDGTRIQAGKTSVSHRWQAHSFSSELEFGQTPIVLSQLLSTNEPVAVTTRHRNVGMGGFEIRVQEEEAADRVHLAETVGWIAIEPGRGTLEGTSYEAGRTPNSVTHLNYAVPFQTSFAPRPSFFAQMQTFNGGDPSTIRYTNLGSHEATIMIEEERSFDYETQHNAETVGWLALESGDVVLPPPESPLGFFRQGGVGGLVFDDPSRLAVAAKIQRSWKEDSMPLGCHEGGCCCSDCTGVSLVDEGLTHRTANYLVKLDTGARNLVASILESSNSEGMISNRPRNPEPAQANRQSISNSARTSDFQGSTRTRRTVASLSKPRPVDDVQFIARNLTGLEQTR